MRPLILLTLGAAVLGGSVLGAAVLISGGDPETPQVEAPEPPPTAPDDPCHRGDFHERVRCLFRPLGR